MSETKVSESKPSGKKQPKARLSALYEVDSEKGTIKLKNRKCPRCGNIMAYHKSSS